MDQVPWIMVGVFFALLLVFAGIFVAEKISDAGSSSNQAMTYSKEFKLVMIDPAVDYSLVDSDYNSLGLLSGVYSTKAGSRKIVLTFSNVITDKNFNCSLNIWGYIYSDVVNKKNEHWDLLPHSTCKNNQLTIDLTDKKFIPDLYAILINNIKNINGENFGNNIILSFKLS